MTFQVVRLIYETFSFPVQFVMAPRLSDLNGLEIKLFKSRLSNSFMLSVSLPAQELAVVLLRTQ